MRRLLAAVRMVIGLGLLAYPAARERYFDYRQQQLLTAWVNSQVVVAWPTDQEVRLAQEAAQTSAPTPHTAWTQRRKNTSRETWKGSLLSTRLGSKYRC